MHDVGPDTEPHNGTDECTDDGSPDTKPHNGADECTDATPSMVTLDVRSS